MSTSEAAPVNAAELSSLSFQEKLKRGEPGYIETLTNNRKKVKEGIVRAYDLHTAADTMGAMLLEERVSSNPILKASLQANLDSYRSEMNHILETPTKWFNQWEISLMDFVKYQIKYDERDVTKIPDKKLNGWLQRQRQTVSGFLSGNRNNLRGNKLESTKDIARLLEHHLHVKWAVFKHKSYDDQMCDLREFQSKYKHVKVRRLQEDFPSLGEWVHKIRKEYDQFKRGEKVPSLTDARISELESMGFIWRVRAPRPRKGDPNYRLRRASKDGDEEESGEEGSSLSENAAE